VAADVGEYRQALATTFEILEWKRPLPSVASGHWFHEVEEVPSAGSQKPPHQDHPVLAGVDDHRRNWLLNTDNR